MEDLSEFLAILGFVPTEKPSPDKLKKRWKEKCRECHPDMENGDEELFKKITHAYKMLSDPSYAFKFKDKPKIVLNISIQYPISFEEAFYGTDIITSFSVTEFDDDYNPIKKEILEVETIKIRLGPGSFDIQPALLPRQGMRKGEMRGVAIIMPMVSPHPRFKIERVNPFVRAVNIIADEQVPLSLLLKGGKLKVDTMFGEKKLKIKPGTAPNSRLSVGPYGCLGGDHIVIVHPVFPDEQKLKTKEWSEFKINWDDKDDITDEEETKFLNWFEELEGHKDV